jgi:uncharacterized protein
MSRRKLRIGYYNQLEIVKEVDFGLYLDGYEDEILLPLQYVTDNMRIGDWIDVFIYRDSEDRLVATTLNPFVTMEQFAYLQVKEVNDMGAFMDWGLPKDLLVPYRQQRMDMRPGRSYLVFAYIDSRTQRIVASAKVENFFLQPEENTFEEGQQVDIMPYEYTEMSIKALVNGQYAGILYRNETFKKLNLGETIKAYVKKVRDDDKLDLTLVAQSYERISGQQEAILQKLQIHQSLPLHDKSDPTLIYQWLEMSKKDFKKAVGGLLKAQRIRLDDKGIHLIGD